MAGNFLGGNFLAGNLLSHVVIFGNFMAGNFLGGNFLGGYRVCVYGGVWVVYVLKGGFSIRGYLLVIRFCIDWTFEFWFEIKPLEMRSNARNAVSR